MLTINGLIKRIKKNRVGSIRKLEKIASVEFKGSGAYREVVLVKCKDGDVVVKVPFRGWGSLPHARAEIAALEKLKDAPASLQRHVPQVYYTDRKTGIVVMKCYEPYEPGKSTINKLNKFFGRSGSDYDPRNFGKDGKTIVVLDLGIT